MKLNRTDGTEIGEFGSLAEAVESGADLRGADLSGADLSGANLSRANLSGANLSGADLSGANLSRANLSWADLSGANLSGADLSRANLSRADLSGANLSGADLCETNLHQANLHGANLAEVQWNGAILSGAMGAPWSFTIGRHVAIVHESQISIGCMTFPVEWWLEHYETVGRKQYYSEAEIEEYGAWIKFVADRLKLRDGKQD